MGFVLCAQCFLLKKKNGITEIWRPRLEDPSPRLWNLGAQEAAEGCSCGAGPPSTPWFSSWTPSLIKSSTCDVVIYHEKINLDLPVG